MYPPRNSSQVILLALVFTFALASFGLKTAPAQRLPSRNFAETLALAQAKMQAKQWAEAAADGSKIIDPEIEASKIIINGAELKDSGFIFGNGPRDKRWRALPPGDSLEFTYALEKYFQEPGIYRVSWKGENFETPTIVFRVMPYKTNLLINLDYQDTRQSLERRAGEEGP